MAQGFTRVTPATIFNETTGFGWLLDVDQTVGALDRATDPLISDLNRDLATTSTATFAINVADANYEVTLTLGDAQRARDMMGVVAEDMFLGNISTVAGEFIDYRFSIPVSDGQLSLSLQDLGGDDPLVAIAGLVIEKRLGDVTPVDEQGGREGNFFFAIESPDTGFVIRGSATTVDSMIDQVVLAAR